MEIIQNILLPGLDFAVPEELHARLNDRTTLFASSKRIGFRTGGKIWLDTYYNSISVGTLKRITVIDSLHLLLEGRGRFFLKIGLNRLGNPHRWLMEEEVQLPLQAPLSLPWSTLEDGMLYVTLEALEPSELTGGSFLTDTQPAAPVKLGVVITHFNRKPFVVPAIARIREQLLSQPDLVGKVELIVVDNSKNLTLEEADGASLIPSQNYGGSGGFARGLLHLIDNNFTHCLFMDDDATCEIESIRRTYILQCFAAKPELAISGALLNEMKPATIIEKGAIYDGGSWRALNHNLDIEDVQNLLIAEQLTERSVYGAWWFFCFKISCVEHFPFPFFVRGDDALFSIMNDFCIENINGISCWGEDFSIKEGPVTRYLGMRCTIAILLQTSNIGRLKSIRPILLWLISNLFSYNYASSTVILNALEDVMKGPKFWIDNIDMRAIFSQLKEISREEEMAKISLADHKLVYRGDGESRLRRFIRMLTINGFLLPEFLLRDQTVFESKSFCASFARVFRFKRVLYYSLATGRGYVAARNRVRCFAIAVRSVVLFSMFFCKINGLKKAYQKALPEMTSEAFWRKIYQEKSE